jgi:hypothetical protein
MKLEEIAYLRHFLVVADADYFPVHAYECAEKFAQGFEKNLSFLVFLSNKQLSSNEQIRANWAERIEQLQKATSIELSVFFTESHITEIVHFTERTETPMLFVEIAKNTQFNDPLRLFKQLKELRVPFVLTKENSKESIDLSKIIVPIGFLSEEKEKAPYSCNMGRYLGSEIILYQANDYGSKTTKNVASVTKLYEQFSLNVSIKKAKADSFGVEKEATMAADILAAGMVLVSTSRDYGLDDILFGPKELHCFKRATCPIMFINPRPDLYVLCW